MAVNKRKIGADHEKMVGEYLKRQGYEIIEYNFYSRAGEIDLIAKEGPYLVFVEVKYRKSDRSGHPFEAISKMKQRTISKCALYYLQKKGMTEVPVRFDVVGVLGEQIELVKNAFEFQL